MNNSTPIRFVLRSLMLTALVFAPLVVDRVRHLSRIESLRPWVYAHMADALLSGKTIWQEADLRLLKVTYLVRLPARKAVLILGGSRAATIAADWFPNRDAWNGAVDVGGVDDDVAFFEACLEAKKIPDSVILELAPALVWDANIVGPRSAGPYLDRALERYGIVKPPQVSDSTQFLPQAHNEWDFIGGTVLPDLRTAWMLPFLGASEQLRLKPRVYPDGRVTFGTFETARGSIGEIVGGNLSGMRPEEIAWRSRSEPDEFARLLFHRFLDDLRSRGVRVIVFLAPVNPLAWDFFQGRGAYNDTWIRSESRARGLTVAGSYSPSVAHATPSDFYDIVHPHPALVRRLLGEAGVIASPDGTSGLR